MRNCDGNIPLQLYCININCGIKYGKPFAVFLKFRHEIMRRFLFISIWQSYLGLNLAVNENLGNFRIVTYGNSILSNDNPDFSIIIRHCFVLDSGYYYGRRLRYVLYLIIIHHYLTGIILMKWLTTYPKTMACNKGIVNLKFNQDQGCK